MDLGAGDGVLTLAASKAGARVLAVELHPARLASLRRRTAGRNVTVLPRDLEEFKAPQRPFRVLANPPFALTTAILRLITASGSGLQRADLVLPATLARQWVRRGARGYRFELGPSVPPSAFSPVARSRCAVLVVRRR